MASKSQRIADLRGRISALAEQIDALYDDRAEIESEIGRLEAEQRKFQNRLHKIDPPPEPEVGSLEWCWREQCREQFRLLMEHSPMMELFHGR